MKELKYVWFCMILPTFFAIYFLILFSIVKIKGRNINLITDWKHKKSIFKMKKVFRRVDQVSYIYSFICMNLIIGLTGVLTFNKICINQIPDLIKKIEVIGSTVLGLTTIAFTLSVAIILFDKKYYIIFSIRDILQQYRFKERLSISILSCMFVEIIQFTFLNQSLNSYMDLIRFILFELAVINNIIVNTFIIWRIIQILFSEQKKELKILEQLYRSFDINKIDRLSFKEKNNWDKEAVEINIEYLLEQYINICKKKKIQKTDYIEYVTTINIYRKKWYDKVKWKFRLIIVICLLISKAVCVDFANTIYITKINIIFSGIVMAITCFKDENIELTILLLLSDVWGYYIHQNNKELFIARTPFLKNNYNKFMNSMNSLNSFFYIWIDYIDEDYRDDEFVKEMYSKMIKWIESLKNKNNIIYMPVFIVGYFLYKKNIILSETKKIYEEVVDKMCSCYEFQRMIYSQIYYISGSREVYMNDITDYLMWLGNKSE